MLGWFKKKKKKEEDTQPVETTTEMTATDAAVTSPEIQQPEIMSSETESPPDIDQTDRLSAPLDESLPESPLEEDEISGSSSWLVRKTERDLEDIPTDTGVEDHAVDVTSHETADISETIPEAPATTVDVEPEVPESSDEIEDIAVTEAAYVKEEEPPSEAEGPEEDERVEQRLKIVKESDVPTNKKKKSLFSRLTERLGKTRESFTYQIDALFLGKKEIDSTLLDDLEEILITADLGVGTTEELLDYTRKKVKRKELASPEALKEALKEKIKTFIVENEADAALVMPDSGPFVIMVIGVNGVGKTTTIGKIANKFLKVGSSVLLVAGDTFRAAAVSQLQIWGKRNNVPVVAQKEGADPSSVVFDALGIAQSKNIDVVLVDTAGRMHTKDNLMEELKKIKRVMGKKLPGAPHEVLLVIDATTGQNAISQARLFDDAVKVTGLTLTKLDGTSKGGIVANICREMKIPIRFIGIGEQMDDLRDFDAGEFVDALFQSERQQAE